MWPIGSKVLSISGGLYALKYGLFEWYMCVCVCVCVCVITVLLFKHVYDTVTYFADVCNILHSCRQFIATASYIAEISFDYKPRVLRTTNKQTN